MGKLFVYFYIFWFLLIFLLQSAITRRFSAKERKDHWLEYAEPVYDRGFIEELKIVYRVIGLFIWYPFFWALYDQTGSR